MFQMFLLNFSSTKIPQGGGCYYSKHNEVGFLRVVLLSVISCFAQFFPKILQKKKFLPHVFVIFFEIYLQPRSPEWGLVPFEAQRCGFSEGSNLECYNLFCAVFSVNFCRKKILPHLFCFFFEINLQPRSPRVGAGTIRSTMKWAF